MLNVITVKNPATKNVSATLIGEQIEGMTMIASKPDMNDKEGWINSIHGEIINTTFRVFPSIEKDITLVEEHYHKQWTESRKTFSVKDYIIDVLIEIKEDIDEKLELGDEISTMIGDGDIIEFVDISKEIKRPINLDNYLRKNEIHKLVFKFHHKDIDIYRETIGYAVYEPTTSTIECFYDPDAFFKSLESYKYGYAGEVHVYDCIYDDVITEDSCATIKSAVMTMLNGFDRASWDKKVSDIFTL